jgi:hypothetical protein
MTVLCWLLWWDLLMPQENTGMPWSGQKSERAFRSMSTGRNPRMRHWKKVVEKMSPRHVPMEPRNAMMEVHGSHLKQQHAKAVLFRFAVA